MTGGWASCVRWKSLEHAVMCSKKTHTLAGTSRVRGMGSQADVVPHKYLDGDPGTRGVQNGLGLESTSL